MPSALANYMGLLQLVAVSFCGLLYYKKKMDFVTVLFFSLILLSGFMFMGHGVADKLVAMLLVVLVWLRGKPTAYEEAGVSGDDSLVRLHRWLFHVFLAYMVFQAFRGAWRTGDIAVLRFVLLFAGLSFLAYTLQRFSTVEYQRVAKMALVASLIYLLAYVLLGLVAENGMGINRFALQGDLWVGTTAAIAILFVAIATLSLFCERPFWQITLVFSLMLLAAFYYQSRLGWLALLGYILLSWRQWGTPKTAALLILYFAFVLVFPWHATANLTWDRFASIAVEEWGGGAQKMSKLSQLKLERFFATTTGGEMTEAQISITQSPKNEVVKNEVVKNEVVKNEVVKNEVVKNEVMAAGNPNAQDQDRRLTLKAVFDYLLDGDLLHVLLGEGYFTHRHNLIPYVEHEAQLYSFAMPGSYQHVVRTSTTNALVADTGLVGLALWLLLFTICAWRSYFLSNRRFVLVYALVVLGLSTMVAQNYEMLFLFVFLMPEGMSVYLARAYASTDQARQKAAAIADKHQFNIYNQSREAA